MQSPTRGWLRCLGESWGCHPRAFAAEEPQQHECCTQVRGRGTVSSQSGAPCQAGTAMAELGTTAGDDPFCRCT